MSDTPPTSEQTGLLPAGTRTLGGMIAWLVGAFAGLGAVLYGLGYLVTQANLRMLGLNHLDLRYDTTFYTERGFEFLQLSTGRVGGVWFWVLVGVTIVLLAGDVLRDFILLFRSGRSIRGWIRSLATKQPFRSLAEGKEIFNKLLLYPGLLVLLSFQLEGHFFFPKELNISGVLYAASKREAEGRDVLEWILSGHENALQERFAEFVNQQFFIGLLVLVCWRVSRAWRWGAMATAPFVVVFVISLTFLPLLCGTLVLPNEFPQVLIRFKQPVEAVGPQADRMYLLNKTDAEFVLWDPHRRKVVWVPSKALASAEIFGSQTLSYIVKLSEGEER